MKRLSCTDYDMPLYAAMMKNESDECYGYGLLQLLCQLPFQVTSSHQNQLSVPNVESHSQINSMLEDHVRQPKALIY